MRPQMNLLGEEGNIFAILGRATRLLKENDMIEEAKEMTRRVFASHNYYKALLPIIGTICGSMTRKNAGTVL